LAKREKYEREHNEAHTIKKKRLKQLAYVTPQAFEIKPMIVHEERKRKEMQQQQKQASKNSKGSSFAIQEHKIAKMVNVQGREKS
jgi:hypothetical protein